jgi:alpha-glucoside transport system substrate-binding protein
MKYVCKTVLVTTSLGLATVLTACGSSSGSNSAASSPTGSTAAATSPTSVAATSVGTDATTAAAISGAAATAGGCSSYAKYGTFKGKTVSMYSAIVAPQDQPYLDSLKEFESCTGIKVQFQGDLNFDSQVQVRIKGGNPPDLAVFAQPGLIKQLAQSGKAVPVGVAADTNVRKYWSTSWQGYVSNADKIYAVPLDANVKSLVWYSPKEFAAKGWTIPTTLAEMQTLSDKIAASGLKPWCMGISAGDATGWPVTDWMSEMMLRVNGPAVYDKWVSHQIPFNGPEATAALNAAGTYLLNNKYMNGGFGDVKSIATTTWQDAGGPVLKNQCAMYKQGSFYAGIWPKGTNVAQDGDVFAFYFPNKDTASKPITGGGSFLTAFSNRPEVQALEAYMSSPQWANEKVAVTPGGGWVSANTGLDVSKLKNPIDALSGQILQDPKTVFRFTGSDLMPAAVGTNSFWKASTDWILGKSTSATLTTIEKSWPSS